MRDNNKIQAVYNALLHPKYEWRTISGIAKQTGLTVEEVQECLSSLIGNNKVRKSYVPDPWGKDLYGLIDRVDIQVKS